MTIVFETSSFSKDLMNLVQYSMGFVEGIKNGEKIFLKDLGYLIKEQLKEYIDSIARTDPQALSHVYEWYQNGSPEARLFHIECSVVGEGLSFKSTFSQSKSLQTGATKPFYNKAEIMENGIPVVIKPVKAQVLSFEDAGEQVFTQKPILISNPGGTAAHGGYEHVFKSFFDNYFSQSFLRSSGIASYLENPVQYKSGLSRAMKTSPKAEGVATGYKWITNAGGSIV